MGTSGGMTTGDGTTRRVLLSPSTPAEAARIVAGARDASWHPEYPFADELEPLTTLARTVAPDPVFTLYRVRERATGLAVGGIGFFGPPDADGAVELGYGLVPRHAAGASRRSRSRPPSGCSRRPASPRRAATPRPCGTSGCCVPHSLEGCRIGS